VTNSNLLNVSNSCNDQLLLADTQWNIHWVRNTSGWEWTNCCWVITWS